MCITYFIIGGWYILAVVRLSRSGKALIVDVGNGVCFVTSVYVMRLLCDSRLPGGVLNLSPLSPASNDPKFSSVAVYDKSVSGKVFGSASPEVKGGLEVFR